MLDLMGCFCDAATCLAPGVQRIRAPPCDAFDALPERPDLTPAGTATASPDGPQEPVQYAVAATHVAISRQTHAACCDPSSRQPPLPPSIPCLGAIGLLPLPRPAALLLPCLPPPPAPAPQGCRGGRGRRSSAEPVGAQRKAAYTAITQERGLIDDWTHA